MAWYRIFQNFWGTQRKLLENFQTGGYSNLCTVKPLSIVPGSIVQFLWSLSESDFIYGFGIYCFPGSIVSLSDSR
jgi:hypothetical protein